MKKLFICAAAALLLAPAAPAPAQILTPPAAYAGPRFPGGPDSLRALTGRSIRQAGATPAGRMLVQFELKADGQPTNYTMVRPPEPLSKPLVEAAATALNYLEAHMPAWQPAPPDPEASSKTQPACISLVLDFTTPLTAQPYAYTDLLPAVPDPVALHKAQKKSRYPISLDYSSRSLKTYTQRQVLYPPAALRQQLQGAVYVYFEIGENGAIERPCIVSSVGEALDLEVLKALKQLPNATVPASLHGRPARVYYSLPITFVIN
ncbi:energy transducer TonB [Hymenobacter ruber]